RHTISKRDWSSDVCSSDLTFVYDGSNRLINDQWRPLNATFTYDSTTGLFSSMNRGLGTTLNLAPASSQGLATSPAVSASRAVARSEERRVGKEGRCRGGQE